MTATWIHTARWLVCNQAWQQQLIPGVRKHVGPIGAVGDFPLICSDAYRFPDPARFPVGTVSSKERYVLPCDGVIGRRYVIGQRGAICLRQRTNRAGSSASRGSCLVYAFLMLTQPFMQVPPRLPYVCNRAVATRNSIDTVAFLFHESLVLRSD